jgi:uncharacterized coiled-coil DUF342 family protein
MTESLSGLRENKDRLNSEAYSQKRERDALNMMAKKWINERDAHNAKLREYLDGANDMKRQREEYNSAVREYKYERENWNRTVGRLSLAVNSHKKHMKGIPLFKLERQLRGLEFRQMTSVLSVEEERDLIKELSYIQDQIKKGEEELMKNEQFRKLFEELQEAKKELAKYVRLVEESAEKAQNAHEEMMSLFEKCDKVRAKGDDAQANFLKVKAQADEFHKRYIEAVKEIHELDRVISGMLHKDKKTRIEEDEKSAKKEAETIFERFKRGEKLSTEDLMTLQKSGYI